MAKVRVQAVLERVGGLPEDVVVNTMHFEDDQPTVDSWSGPTGTTNMDGLINRVRTFYGAIGPTVLSSLLTGFGTIKVYDMADPLPRAPIEEVPFGWTHNTANPVIPAEVALCLSFKGEGVSGQAGGRRRGRIFLGPLHAFVMQLRSNDLAPTAGHRDTILQAAENMARGAAGSYRLAVFSPTAAAGNDTADGAWTDASEFWIDDAFDTMRSRGGKPTSRRRQIIGTEVVLAA